MADIAKLKRPSDKGTPPTLEEAPGNTALPPRQKEEPTRALQFNLPESEFEAFSAEAAGEFGHTRGAKIQFFRMLMQLYRDKSGR